MTRSDYAPRHRCRRTPRYPGLGLRGPSLGVRVNAPPRSGQLEPSGDGSFSRGAALTEAVRDGAASRSGLDSSSFPTTAGAGFFPPDSAPAL